MERDTEGVTEGRYIWRGRDRGEKSDVRQMAYRKINGGKTTVVMRYRNRDKGEIEKRDRGETERMQREETERMQREDTKGVTEGRDGRKNGGKEIKGKRQRGRNQL